MKQQRPVPDLSRRRYRAAVGWAVVLSWGGQGIALLSTFVLAALLGPHAFGVVAMAAIYISFLEMFLDQGLGSALIQRKDLSASHLDSAFWLTLLLGLGLSGISIALSGWWASANGTPLLGPIICALSLLLPIKGLTVVQDALLRRKLDFKSLALRANISTLVGVVVGIGMAFKGYGAWALVGEDLVSAVVRLALLWKLSDWRPGLRFCGRAVRELFSFSFFVFAGTVGTFVQRRADALLIGLYFGPIAVGIYRLADRLVNSLIELVTRPLVVVALPHFSRLKDEGGCLAEGVASCVRSSALVTLPAMAMLAVLAEEVCAALGPKWQQAAIVTQILCLLGAARAITLFTGPVLQAVGRPKNFAGMTWLLAVANVAAFVGVGTYLRGQTDGVQTVGMAASRVAVFCLMYVPLNVWMTLRASGLTLRMLLPALLPAAITTATAMSIAVLALWPIPATWPAAARLIVTGSASGLITCIVILALEPALRNMVFKRLGLKRPGAINEPAAQAVPVAVG